MSLLFLCAVPEGPPLNITFEVLGPNLVKFSWAPPAEELRNGVIVGFQVSCVVDGNQMGDPITENPGNLDRMTTLQGLTAATQYSCSLAAETSAE